MGIRYRVPFMEPGGAMKRRVVVTLLAALALAAAGRSLGSKTIPGDRLDHQRWFWIDDRGVSSKRVLGFFMLRFSLAENGGQPPLPVPTIPAG